jgi:hypothetical protein
MKIYEPSQDSRSGAFARIVRHPSELADALHIGQHESRCAVLDVWLSNSQ